MSMIRCGVVTFPGSNCDDDMLHVVSEVMGQEAVRLWHKETSLHDVDCVLLPGGFSYGDYLRAGAIAQMSPVMNSVKGFAAQGGYVLGICNGFQILCESGLLPGALLRNASQKFICKNVDLEVVTSNSALTSNLNQGDVVMIPIAHAEGRFHADAETLARLQANDQIIFRYSDNPNGSLDSIAGICNEGRNVYGMMPHPERAAEELLGNTDGKALFVSFLQSVKEATQSAV